jgi:hypothetical protein
MIYLGSRELPPWVSNVTFHLSANTAYRVVLAVIGVSKSKASPFSAADQWDNAFPSSVTIRGISLAFVVLLGSTSLVAITLPPYTK